MQSAGDTQHAIILVELVLHHATPVQLAGLDVAARIVMADLERLVALRVLDGHRLVGVWPVWSFGSAPRWTASSGASSWPCESWGSGWSATPSLLGAAE